MAERARGGRLGRSEVRPRPSGRVQSVNTHAHSHAAAGPGPCAARAAVVVASTGKLIWMLASLSAQDPHVQQPSEAGSLMTKQPWGLGRQMAEEGNAQSLGTRREQIRFMALGASSLLLHEPARPLPQTRTRWKSK